MALNLFSLLNLIDVVLRCFISEENGKLLIPQFNKILSVPTCPEKSSWWFQWIQNQPFGLEWSETFLEFMSQNVVLKKSLFAPPKNKYLTVWTNISAILWKLQRRPVKSNLMCWKLLRFLSTNTSNSSYDNICWLMILSFL